MHTEQPDLAGIRRAMEDIASSLKKLTTVIKRMQDEAKEERSRETDDGK